MEPTNKPSLGRALLARLSGPSKEELAVDFLPDADEMERQPLPKFAQITVKVLLAALASFILWSTFSEIDMVVTARGRLINPLPNIVVQTLDTAQIASINVRVGQLVKKGELLATLDPTFTQADEAQLRLRMQSLDTQVAAMRAELSLAKPGATGKDADSILQAQLTGERQANYAAQLAKMEQTVTRLRATLETNRRDQQVLSARLRSVREIETMQEKLIAQNFGARLSLLQAQDKRLEVERDMLLTRNREQELASELAASQSEQAAFMKGWRQKLMEELLVTTRERDSINEQLQKADKRLSMVQLLAPEDGVVLEIAKLSPGSVVRAAETFFTLVPVGAQMEAEVQIDAADVGYVRSGDAAKLKLDAFPFQKHGALTATVRTISEDAFRRETAQTTGGDTYYMSRVAYGSAALKHMNRARLLPGMTVSAEIVVGKRSVISYLLWPLTKTVGESIREP